MRSDYTRSHSQQPCTQEDCKVASLKGFIKPEETDRISVSLPNSALRELAQYVVYIRAREGFEVERADVLAEVIKAWAASDKDYVRWVSQELGARDGDRELQARVNALLKAGKDVPTA